jgi:hypothetical protein
MNISVFGIVTLWYGYWNLLTLHIYHSWTIAVSMCLTRYFKTNNMTGWMFNTLAGLTIIVNQHILHISLLHYRRSVIYWVILKRNCNVYSLLAWRLCQISKPMWAELWCKKYASLLPEGPNNLLQALKWSPCSTVVFKLNITVSHQLKFSILI